ncbi:hypothetical protein DVH05_013606 [Phytophthora capsici]|nr:hypothetical protein DVH05_013606 [Phytophthora capsici]
MEDMDNIVNLLSPVAGTKDRKEAIKFFQARKFPALVNCAVTDWFQPWPKEALLSVGREKLKEIGDLFGSEKSRSTGEKKLKETRDTVPRLEVELKKANVETESKKAGDEAAKCAIIQTEVTEKQRSTQEDLAKAEPAVEQAMAALDSLNKKDLGECKTMSKPPAGVDDVFSATMVLLAGVHPNVQVTKAGKVKDVKWGTVNSKWAFDNASGVRNALWRGGGGGRYVRLLR